MSRELIDLLEGFKIDSQFIHIDQTKRLVSDITRQENFDFTCCWFTTCLSFRSLRFLSCLWQSKQKFTGILKRYRNVIQHHKTDKVYDTIQAVFVLSLNNWFPVHDL